MADHTRTVLIVDDEPQVLRLVEKMLRPRRIHLLIAPHAAGALEICEREPVDALISDVQMPGMNGARLAECVLKLHPEAAVLLISGYAQEAPPLGKAGQVRFLRKPFFPSELIERLREMLPEA